jgi:hypothetical protein
MGHGSLPECIGGTSADAQPGMAVPPKRILVLTIRGIAVALLYCCSLGMGRVRCELMEWV